MIALGRCVCLLYTSREKEEERRKVVPRAVTTALMLHSLRVSLCIGEGRKNFSSSPSRRLRLSPCAPHATTRFLLLWVRARRSLTVPVSHFHLVLHRHPAALLTLRFYPC
ncbi:hypothetical protein L596_006477 [Steinernema carpocapsae]|uniref:Uncharacterized protein n=1 Tax=Steinernema carpocapsae TaxID=34508 RepID=A0A4U8V267_STECR|nr:hypothetical protein L596_006477 [Steinernema carpocapsae]